MRQDARGPLDSEAHGAASQYAHGFIAYMRNIVAYLASVDPET